MSEQLNEVLAKHLNGDEQGKDRLVKALDLTHKLSRMGRADIDTVVRAMDTQESGFGQEWADVDSFSPDVIQAVVLQRKVSALFERRSIPRSPFIWPVQGGRPTAYVPTENTGSSGQTASKSSKFGTHKTTFATEYLQTTIWTSDKFEDDSIATVSPQVQENSLFGIVDGEEDAMINASTGETHIDYDTEQAKATDATNVKYAFHGLRARVNSGAKVDLSGGDIINAIIQAAAKMGDYGVNVSDLALITGVSGHATLLQSGKLQTLDKFGSAAALLTGGIKQVLGIDVVISKYIRENLHTTGVNANGEANASTIMLLVNKRAYAQAIQKEVSFEPHREPLFNQSVLIARERFDFQSWYPSSHNPVALIHNIPSIA